MIKIRWMVALIMTGLVLTWTGLYIKASQPSVCIDAINPRDSGCYGNYTSDAWQATGLISLVVGIALVLGTLLLGIVQRRKQHSVAGRVN